MPRLAGIPLQAFLAAGRSPWVFDWDPVRSLALPRGATFTRNSSKWAMRGGRLIEFAADVPALTDDGFLHEEARTNLCLYANDTSQIAQWNEDATTVTRHTNDTLIAGEPVTRYENPSGTHYPYYNHSAQADGTYTWSRWLRSVGNDPTTLKPAVFNGTAWIMGDAITLTGAWQRVSHTFTLASASELLVGFEVVGAGTFEAIGAQLEVGAYATSLMVTTGADGVRAADSLHVDIPWMNQVQGTIYAEWMQPAIDTSRPCHIVNVNEGVGTSYHVLYVGQSGTNCFYQVGTGAGTQAAVSLSGIAAGAIGRIAAAFKFNEVNAAKDGVLGTLDTASGIPSGLTRMTIGNNTAAARNLNGYIRRIRVRRDRLADVALPRIAA